ncbi:hypothetical protein IT568_13655, partial [bacterium]|nr:hypothetical protein [bacterium]
MEDNFPIQIVGKDNVDKIPEIIPIVPLRGTILYPGTLLPLAVTRKPSMDAI